MRGPNQIYAFGGPDHSQPISELKVGEFSGLLSLIGLYLPGNDISTLPAGIFAGLFSWNFSICPATKLILCPLLCH